MQVNDFTGDDAQISSAGLKAMGGTDFPERLSDY